MATTRMEYDTSRARTELGYTSMPARTALARAARWFVDNGSVKPARVARIRDAGRLEREIDLVDPGRTPSPSQSQSQSQTPSQSQRNPDTRQGTER
jgi:hypothetical protein